jgi:cell division protein FtsN
VRARPRRRGGAAPHQRKSRLGSFLFLVGLLGVLGGTFVAGAMAGRFSFRPTAAATNGRNAERPAKPAPPPQPELTFYRELTAPLTSPPLPPRPAAKPMPKREPVAADAPNAADASPRTDTVARYTVQVGSYNVRAQADALRDRLASQGHEAYIAEAEAGGFTRYRVRIGTFATADEARQAAVRLASEARVATYVTTR